MPKISPAYITNRSGRQFNSYISGVAADARHTFKTWVLPVLRRRKFDLTTYLVEDGSHGWTHGWTLWSQTAVIITEDNAPGDQDRHPELKWLINVLSAKVIGTNITFGCFMPQFFYNPKEDKTRKTKKKARK